MPDLRAAKLDDFARAGIVACADAAAAAIKGAGAVLSVVTADQALIAAQSAAAVLDTGALWLDMNSVAPDTKRAAAASIEAAGGRYVDVAVMAPGASGAASRAAAGRRAACPSRSRVR